jgi:hypothetical protein
MNLAFSGVQTRSILANALGAFALGGAYGMYMAYAQKKHGDILIVPNTCIQQVDDGLHVQLSELQSLLLKETDMLQVEDGKKLPDRIAFIRLVGSIHSLLELEVTTQAAKNDPRKIVHKDTRLRGDYLYALIKSDRVRILRELFAHNNAGNLSLIQDHSTICLALVKRTAQHLSNIYYLTQGLVQNKQPIPGEVAAMIA